MKCPGARISARCTSPLVSTQSLNHTGRSEVRPAQDPNVLVRTERVPDVRGNGHGGGAVFDLPVAVALSRVPRVRDPHGPERASLLFDVTLEGVRRREGVGRVNCRPETRREVLLEAVAGKRPHRPDRLLEQLLPRGGWKRWQAEGRPATRRDAD